MILSLSNDQFHHESDFQTRVLVESDRQHPSLRRPTGIGRWLMHDQLLDVCVHSVQDAHHAFADSLTDEWHVFVELEESKHLS